MENLCTYQREVKSTWLMKNQQHALNMLTAYMKALQSESSRHLCLIWEHSGTHMDILHWLNIPFVISPLYWLLPNFFDFEWLKRSIITTSIFFMIIRIIFTLNISKKSWIDRNIIMYHFESEREFFQKCKNILKITNSRRKLKWNESINTMLNWMTEFSS